ncbi:hypothetical protein EN781_00110 [Mesorhizobium sp. M4A.F.Ca.ET.090.04.2.1]|uniref:hypothetical protein n=1 Tax=Mesorhizobium sp. M4A.F.Ca.ET.090.04.2.1 TaxID=2496663 RepID=UPI000FCB61D2|nr:hypothetical protein [Mesorhizobium sp. M4A.F.Ca.ET.090.04.2.1]RVC47575.1 hypothetical protein EN781_00110 [Mesorhizobium sp. M4A.F.Ca.ET.090.04.2.1]
MEVAGTVTIQIGGNIAPFEQALAKANQLAATFDAQISQKLSGAGVSESLAKIAASVDQTNALLARMSGSSTQATAALGKVTTSSQQASAAISQAGSAAAAATAEINRIGTTGATAGLGAATVSAKEFAAALEAAGGDLKKVNVTLEEQSQEVKAVTDALRGYSQAQIDAFRSQQQGENFNRDLTERIGIIDTATKSARESAAVFQALGVTETEVALGARSMATEFTHGASAARLSGAQIAELGHIARSTAGTLLAGGSAMQALGYEANRIASVLTIGQGGVGGTLKALGDMAGATFGRLTSLATSTPGLIATAGIGAIAAVSAYVISARNDIKSVDEVLKEHKALIDEVAGAYPEAAKAAASYAEAAKRIPKSVATADIVEQAKENKKTLDDTMGYLSTRLTMLSQEWGLVGTAGTKAFADLAEIAKSGAADAADQLESALGRLRIDPALNENAHQFAKELQSDATAAAKLQDALKEKNAIKDIVADGKRASQSLYDVSKGFKDIGSSAGGADATIAKLFGTLNSGATDRFGVLRSAGNIGGQFASSVQTTLGAFQQVNDAVQLARQSQLQSYLELGSQLRSTKQDIDTVKQAIATSAGRDNIDAYFGDISNIKGAQQAISDATSTVHKLFDALKTGNASVSGVYQSLDMVRQSLIGAGLGADQVNKFVDSLVRAYQQMNADSSAARQLNAAIQAIKNRTVTITVVTRKVGTGTQTTYDVPNSNGGTSGVGVTRYGGADGESSGPSLSSYSVPTEGGSYGSQGGSGGSGSSTVNVTRFGGARAAGGPVDAQTPYWVGEHGPELVVPKGAGTVIPNAQSVMFHQALADAQSGFTGREPTREDDRLWTVLMNVEANTRKTAQILDDIKTATASSASALSGGSSSGGSSTGTGTTRDPQYQQYLDVLKQVRANFQAAGVLSGQPIGYGLGRSASPQQIAHNIVYGGASPLGAAGSTSYERDSAAAYSEGIRSVFRGVNNLVDANGQPVKTYPGFDTGGMIGGGPGDTQKVEFFKNPNERVIIARPDQFQDVRQQPAANQNSASSATDRPINISMPIYIQGGAQVSKDSIAEMKRQATMAVREAIRGINGR